MKKQEEIRWGKKRKHWLFVVGISFLLGVILGTTVHAPMAVILSNINLFVLGCLGGVTLATVACIMYFKQHGYPPKTLQGFGVDINNLQDFVVDVEQRVSKLEKLI